MSRRRVSTPDAASPPNLRERLRVGTRDLHQAAERALDSDRRLADRDAYLELLERLWSLHQGLAEAFAGRRFGAFDAARASRRKAAALAADIADLSGAPPVGSPAAFAFAGDDEALGGAYVQVGSTLGGLVLFRAASVNLSVAADRGGRFLAADSEAREAWRSLVETLTARSSAGPAADAAVRGARQAFTRFRDVLRA